jgi:hypothetical protein
MLIGQLQTRPESNFNRMPWPVRLSCANEWRALGEGRLPELLIVDEPVLSQGRNRLQQLGG